MSGAPGGLQSLQDSLISLLAKLNKIPIEGIGNDAQQTLLDANVLIQRLNTEVVPQARQTLAAAQTALATASRAIAAAIQPV